MAVEIARALGAPLDVLIVRKLGLPWQPEAAMGALASGGILLANEELLSRLPVSESEFREVVARETKELHRREELYRGGRAPLDAAGRTVILADDGIATGSTMKVAILSMRAQRAARIIVAVPVGAASTLRELATLADEVVCPHAEENLRAVGLWYRDFSQVTDDEVCRLLATPTPQKPPGEEA